MRDDEALPHPSTAWVVPAILVLLAGLSIAARWRPVLLAPAALIGGVGAGYAAWRRDPEHLEPGGGEDADHGDDGDAESDEGAEGARGSDGDGRELPGGERLAPVAVLALAAVALVAAWIGSRPPWTPWAGALIWTGAIALAARPQPRTRLEPTPVVLGALTGALVGWLAAHAWPGPLAVPMAAVLVPVGRLAIVRVAQHASPWAVGAFALAVTVPFAARWWGVAAVAVEAGAALLVLDEVPDAEVRDAWALGGIAAALGAGLQLIV